MKDYGLVSIITPSYNSSKFIGETIESIQAQTYKHWELLITDDCSTDDSIEIIRRYAETDDRIKLYCLSHNSGAGIARNNSIRQASGRYIAFCDSDDKWYPEKLYKQLAFMDNGGYTLTYTSYDTCDETGNICGYVQCLSYITYCRIIRDNGIGCLTAIYDASKLGKQMMPAIRKRQDWCLWIRIIKDIGKAHGLQLPLALHRVRKGSISSNKASMLKYNYDVYHRILGYGRITAALLLGGYFLPYYLYKKIKQKSDYKNRIKKL